MATAAKEAEAATAKAVAAAEARAAEDAQAMVKRLTEERVGAIKKWEQSTTHEVEVRRHAHRTPPDSLVAPVARPLY